MQRAMDRLEGFTSRHGKLVLAAWLILLAAAIPFTVRQTEHLTSGGFQVPGSDADKVDKAIEDFEGAQSESLAVVLAMREGADASRVRSEIERVERATSEVPHVALALRDRRAAEEEAGRGPITVVPLEVKGDQDQVSDAAIDLRDELGVGEGPRGGVETYFVGQQALWAGMQELSKEDLEASERVGFPIVLLILLAVFGSLAAATLPLALGFVSVAVTGAGIFFLSQATDMSVFVTNVASMIGIGVAVDYSLFVLARYREEMRAGRDRDEARRIAMRTSGIAVAFSGVTVMVALAGLFLVDSTMIRSMAMGAILVVALSVLAATTLLPALIRVLGKRAYARGRLATAGGLVVRAFRSRPRRRGSTSPDRSSPGFWERWTGAVMGRPLIAILASGGVLAVLAVPALSLEWGDGALRQFPEGHETRTGAELAAQELGPGASGPTTIVARFEDGTATTEANRRAVEAYAAGLARDHEVARVTPPQPSRDGRAVMLTVTPRHDPESDQARALVDRLRDDAVGDRRLAAVAEMNVGGATAYVEDFKDLVSGSMWKVLLFVMGFSYLVLLVLLRSAVLPLKAVLVNLLSVGAAYGVLVALFQWGWLDGITGYDSLGYINTMTPPFLLAIVFGLSMDYEVFLLTRIRERYDAHGDNRRAVAEGLQASARTISSAALIMVAVFTAFAFTGVPSIKEIGVGLAVAIALDATLVRLVLVPATMEILGHWNWWLPGPLAKLLPRADFEGAPARV
jgi:RND superfamily putative drug exporter